MVTISMRYSGELHCEATHGPSSTTLATDAPIDNQGRGESFSPTDLIATSLGACILTTMGIAAKKLAIDMAGATATVEKIMVATPSRRIGGLPTHVTMPSGIPTEHRETLEQAGHHCPVKKSIHPDIDATITFTWL